MAHVQNNFFARVRRSRCIHPSQSLWWPFIPFFEQSSLHLFSCALLRDSLWAHHGEACRQDPIGNELPRTAYFQAFGAGHSILLARCLLDVKWVAKSLLMMNAYHMRYCKYGSSARKAETFDFAKSYHCAERSQPDFLYVLRMSSTLLSWSCMEAPKSLRWMNQRPSLG